MEYVKKGSTAVVRTDDGEKMVRNNANLYEILVSENIKEQLQFYNKRDVSRLSFLERRKFKLNKANFGTAISTVAATGALTVLDGVNAIDTEFSRGLQVGAFVLGTSIIFVNESVLTRRRELLGLRKCVKYEVEKIAALENKIESLKYDSVDESLDDHGKFLSENPRYSEYGLFEKKNYKNQAQALEDAGYSTAKDKNGQLIYAEKLIGIIEKYNLMQYD